MKKKKTQKLLLLLLLISRDFMCAKKADKGKAQRRVCGSIAKRRTT